MALCLGNTYLPFLDNKFGIWFVDENFYIGNNENKILIDGNDLIVNNERYKGSRGLWRLLTNPNRKKMDQETYDTWWTSKENFTEKDLASYKEILIKTHSIYQHNNPSTKKPKSSVSKKWNDLVSKIWKEVRTPKVGSGITKKYHKGSVEYKYFDNLNQLMQHLYFINAEEKAGNSNFRNEKMGIINFFTEQLENIVDKPKGTEYIVRFVSCLPKELFKTGILNTLLNKLGNVVPEMHLPGYNYCGPFTRLDKRLGRGDAPINKMDAGCQKHDIFYHDHKDTKDRHVADKEQADNAKERMYASNASVSEKINSSLLRAAMNSKVAFGMGLRWG